MAEPNQLSHGTLLDQQLLRELRTNVEET